MRIRGTAGLIAVELVALILLGIVLIRVGATPAHGFVANLQPAVRTRASQPAPLACPYQVDREQLTQTPSVLTVCANQAHDAALRTPLSRADQAATTARVAFIRSVVVPPSSQPDPVQAAGYLTQAGFTHFLVRYARASDPAPVGSLLWGVDVGHGCVIGYSGLLTSAIAVGYLPDGTCLSP